MERQAFRMKLKPGFEEEYRKRHDEIWPELSEALADAGITDYSIFLDPADGSLFAVRKLAAGNTAADLAAHPVVRRWWDFMAPVMDVNPDNSPVEVPLVEVFHQP